MIQIKLENGACEQHAEGIKAELFVELGLLPVMAFDILTERLNMPPEECADMLIGAIQTRLIKLAEEKK
ncbi:MAG: hypothetical protein MJ123_11850 [Lachnospiraceae bacterium]|nr:hypothetical protein [Lachnospiraceae bacterium]